jgi:2-dehydro-3-deoxygluconokinase
MTRVVTLGEILLRLKSPHFERLFQSSLLEATFGGGEANVAISLAHFGLDAVFVSVLPANAVGEAALAELRRHNVDTSHIVRRGERLGIYFLEAGADQRPSVVLYDRGHSSMTEAVPGAFDWDTLFDGASWFHISGITPALSQSTADLSRQAVQAAREQGVTVSCDYNYRSKLWKYGANSADVMRELVRFADVVIAGEDDCKHCLDIPVKTKVGDARVESAEIKFDRYETRSRAMFESFPNLSYQAMTLRESHTARHNDWSACLFNGRQFLQVPGTN